MIDPTAVEQSPDASCVVTQRCHGPGSICRGSHDRAEIASEFLSFLPPYFLLFLSEGTSRAARVLTTRGCRNEAPGRQGGGKVLGTIADDSLLFLSPCMVTMVVISEKVQTKTFV